MKHRMHVVSLPHTQTTLEYECCAYTSKVRKFCNMMMDQGNEVFLYAGEQNEACCTEHVSCITEADRRAVVGKHHFVMAANFDAAAPHWRKFNAQAAIEIGQRAEPHDFLCLIGGCAQKPIADAHPGLMAVEFGVGYQGVFTRYRVWESYAWQSAMYSYASNGRPMNSRGCWFDAVIPGYFEPEFFPCKLDSERGKHLLFVGRVIEDKGVHVAADAAQRAGTRLRVGGPLGDPRLVKHPAVDYLGVLDVKARAKEMGSAQAVIMPTLYCEPFGNVAIEAMATGTPVVTTDWGAMTETVVHGKSGYHCRSMREFVEGAQKAKHLSHLRIHAYARKRFSVTAIAPKYQAYFDRLSTLWNDGFYA